MKNKFLIGGIIALAIVFSGQFGSGSFLDIKIAFGYGGGVIGGGSGTPSPTMTSVNYPLTLSASQEGTLTQSFNNGLTAKLTVSQNSVSIGGSTTFKIASGANASALNGTYFDISASDQSGNRVRDFSNNLNIVLSGLTLPVSVADLGVYYLDETSQTWVLVPGAVFNPATSSVSFYVNHLTKFAVLEKKSAGTAATPSVIATPSTSNFVLSEKGLVTKVDKALTNRLAGRILLQIELHGEAWYVNPVNGTKYFLSRPADAFAVMRSLGLGINNKDFNSYKNNIAPARLAGRILIKVEDKGMAYYVNPVDLKMHYLGRPADAFNVMRTLGLGITNVNLRKITVSEIK